MHYCTELFTGGDPRTKTNHLFLLDATDLEEMAVISPALLSPIGENDITSVRLPQELTAHAIPVKSVKADHAQEGHPARQAVDGDLQDEFDLGPGLCGGA